jgi:hypothetical protein
MGRHTLPRLPSPCLLGALILTLFSPLVARADWGAGGLPVATGVNDQRNPVVAPDGAGGAIVAWEDVRDGFAHIYAQRLDSNGAPLWTLNGVPVCTAYFNHNSPDIASDGAGGAVIAWVDSRNYPKFGIYVQRIDATGAPLWNIDGVELYDDYNFRGLARVVSDGTGGAIVVWGDLRDGNNFDVYARRVDAAGNALWSTNGVGICTAIWDQSVPIATSDGAGGAIITWQDARAGVQRIFAQRIDGAGATLWAPNGIPLNTAAAYQNAPNLVADGSGGAVVAWMQLAASQTHVYAQRVSPSGDLLWPVSGVPLCTAFSDQRWPTLATDGAGGAIVAWQDGRSADRDIYAQRVGPGGEVVWLASGRPVTAAPGDQLFENNSTMKWFNITSDGVGGAYVSWQDQRAGIGEEQADIYVQRLDSFGNRLLAPDGDPVSAASNAQLLPVVASDALGGALITWQDARNTPIGQYPSYDVYAQRVFDGVVTTIASLIDVAVSAAEVRLTWLVSRTGLRASVERRAATNDWLALGDVTLVGDSRIEFVDRGVVPGRTYEYRLAFVQDGRTVCSGQTTVSIPGAALAITSIAPNPASDAIEVKLQLEQGPSATLELIDLAGRRVLAREVGSARGEQPIKIDVGGHGPSGLYWLRVRQGDKSVIARIAITH